MENYEYWISTFWYTICVFGFFSVGLLTHRVTKFGICSLCFRIKASWIQRGSIFLQPINSAQKLYYCIIDPYGQVLCLNTYKEICDAQFHYLVVKELALWSDVSVFRCCIPWEKVHTKLPSIVMGLTTVLHCTPVGCKLGSYVPNMAVPDLNKFWGVATLYMCKAIFVYTFKTGQYVVLSVGAL